MSTRSSEGEVTGMGRLFRRPAGGCAAPLQTSPSPPRLGPGPRLRCSSEDW